LEGVLMSCAVPAVCVFLQDTEFTVQDGKLFMLQTRNGKRTGPAALKIAIDLEAEVGRLFQLETQIGCLQLCQPPTGSVLVLCCRT
jgi:hypothetical protein